MRHTIRWFAVCALAAGLCVAAQAQEKIDLKINYEPGKYFVTKDVTMHVNTAGDRASESTIRSTMAMDMEVGKPDAQGTRQLAVTYRQIKFEQKQDDQTVKFDSTAKAQADQVPPVGKLFQGMLDKTVTITLDGQGQVTAIAGIDEMIASMLKSAGMDEKAAATLKEQFGERMVEETFGQMFLMPGKPVAKGDTWEVDKSFDLPVIGPATYTQICTLKDIKDGVAVVGIKGSLTSEGGQPTATSGPGAAAMTINELTVEGTTQMEIATGMAKQADVTQKGTMTLTVGEGGAKKEIKITLNGQAKTTIEKVTKAEKAE